MMEREIQIVSDSAALLRTAAEIYISAARQSVAKSGRFAVALSGGSTPKEVYSLLADDAELCSQVPWRQTYFFFGDERNVGPNDSESNYRMAQEAMLAKLPIDTSQVHRIKSEGQDIAMAATLYADDLRRFFQPKAGEFPRFDLVLLGLGPDGHTASLFPGTRALQERNLWVCPNWVPKLQAYRITLTVPVINHAVRVLFLVRGGDKAQAVKAVLEGAYEPQQLPAQMINPHSGSLSWLLDRAAGAFLERQR
ncbi:MAG TPA: 6-phosphogluconolactonase [Candidatus Saccharimonadales bacterium]|nr:6-phosphogluconolactonase [Candidatus Saccharimonadales bacterium]